MSTQITPSLKLMNWHKRFRLDGDLVRCQECGRGLHVSYPNEAISHQADCVSQDSDRPWIELHCHIEEAIVVKADPLADHPQLPL